MAVVVTRKIGEAQTRAWLSVEVRLAPAKEGSHIWELTVCTLRFSAL